MQKVDDHSKQSNKKNETLKPIVFTLSKWLSIWTQYNILSIGKANVFMMPC